MHEDLVGPDRASVVSRILKAGEEGPDLGLPSISPDTLGQTSDAIAFVDLLHSTPWLEFVPVGVVLQAVGVGEEPEEGVGLVPGFLGLVLQTLKADIAEACLLDREVGAAEERFRHGDAYLLDQVLPGVGESIGVGRRISPCDPPIRCLEQRGPGPGDRACPGTFDDLSRFDLFQACGILRVDAEAGETGDQRWRYRWNGERVTDEIDQRLHPHP